MEKCKIIRLTESIGKDFREYCKKNGFKIGIKAGIIIKEYLENEKRK